MSGCTLTASVVLFLCTCCLRVVHSAIRFFFQSTINPIQRLNSSFLMCMNFYLFYHANIIIQFLKDFLQKKLALYQHKNAFYSAKKEINLHFFHLIFNTLTISVLNHDRKQQSVIRMFLSSTKIHRLKANSKGISKSWSYRTRINLFSSFFRLKNSRKRKKNVHFTAPIENAAFIEFICEQRGL